MTNDPRPTGANNQPVVLMQIGGRLIEVDAEIAHIVRALNDAGHKTIASCSGHGHRPGRIALADGREIIIARDFAEAGRIDALFPVDINDRDDELVARTKAMLRRCGRKWTA